ncbi:MAG TPA: class I SAM-dependent methyltransferase [Candidatus Binatia bacterium]|nr:class I SAM-dependent methyltransferase [Candidatus Binatia bacterium]
MPVTQIPYPPVELRTLVSPNVDDSYYDNPTGNYVFGPLNFGPLAAGEAYQRIFDFGCGCGREARRLLLQKDRPKLYVGLDISPPMIQWCRDNLEVDNFSFHHHDVWSISYAPDNSRNRTLPIAHLGSNFSLIEANSVFTHLCSDQTEFYLREMVKMLSDKGIIRLTIFFFNKKWFPMMGDSNNTLFVDERDPTQAVYYDWNYFRELVKSLGYRIAQVQWTEVPGFHNIVVLARNRKFSDLGDSIPPASVFGFAENPAQPLQPDRRSLWQRLFRS